MREVVLVPWRGGDPERERNWQIARPWIEELGAPVFTGDGTQGKWSRSAAINDAARRAGTWDVAVVVDADTIPDPGAVRRGVDHVLQTRGAVRPHDHLWRLNSRGTTAVARGGPPHPMARAMHQGLQQGGGVLVIERSAFEKIGGFDERFVSWGIEDSCMNLMLLVHADWDRLPGEAWHLYHAPDRRDPDDTAANRRMYYDLLAKNVKLYARRARERGWPPVPLGLL